MRALCLAAAALVVAASASLAAESGSSPGIVWSPRGAVLTRVDTVSRAALPDAQSALLGHAHYGLSTSPDGALLATTSGIDRLVHVVALGDVRRSWTIGPLSSRASSTFWIGRRTLVAGTGDAIVMLDVDARSVGEPVPVGGVIIGEAATMGRYVALVAPASRIGPLHLVSVGASGALRTIVIPGLRGGRAIARAHAPRLAIPGLALSPGGTRAYIVSRGSRIVVANLRAGSAQAIAVRADRTLQSAAKAQTGWQRIARLLGTGTLVSTGGDFSAQEYAGLLGAAPAGLRITDLQTHRTHLAVPGVNQFRICAGQIVAARSQAGEGAAGVVALDRKGLPLWSQFAGQGALLAGCTSRYVYLSLPGNGLATLDVHSGAVLETHHGSAGTVIESI